MKPNSAHAPRTLEAALERFYVDFTPSKPVGFLIMRFGETAEHKYIAELVSSVEAATGVPLLRADHRIYHPDLFENVRVYMHACTFSLAFFEDAESRGYNPNVALEVGYLQALGKPILPLKSNSLSTMPSDLLSRLYIPFNREKPIAPLVEQVASWVRQQVMSAPELNGEVTSDSIAHLLRSIYPSLPLEDDEDHIARHVKGLRQHGYQKLTQVVELLKSTDSARLWVNRGRLPHFAICAVSNALAIRHSEYRDEPFWKGTTVSRLREAEALFFPQQDNGNAPQPQR